MILSARKFIFLTFRQSFGHPEAKYRETMAANATTHLAKTLGSSLDPFGGDECVTKVEGKRPFVQIFYCFYKYNCQRSMSPSILTQPAEKRRRTAFRRACLACQAPRSWMFGIREECPEYQKTTTPSCIRVSNRNRKKNSFWQDSRTVPFMAYAQRKPTDTNGTPSHALTGLAK